LDILKTENMSIDIAIEEIEIALVADLKKKRNCSICSSSRSLLKRKLLKTGGFAQENLLNAQEKN